MIEIIILSFVQGVAEFIPVSSSSHLILMSNLLNFENQSLSIDVSLHIGSLLAVLVYFYKDIISFVENKILFFKIFISSLPVVIVGFLLVETETKRFKSNNAACFQLACLARWRARTYYQFYVVYN